MRLLTLIILLLTIFSCKENVIDNEEKKAVDYDVQDTVIVWQKNELNEYYEKGFLSRSYSYRWVAGTDTLDFGIIAKEYLTDSSLHLHIMHEQPVTFSTVLFRVEDCLKLINEHISVSKLGSLNFEPIIYYQDLSKELSAEYESEIGRKNVGYQRMNEFLFQSSLNTQMNNFLKPLDKEVDGYSIEKFHLLYKEHYNQYLDDTNLGNYPEFTLHGMGLGVKLR